LGLPLSREDDQADGQRERIAAENGSPLQEDDRARRMGMAEQGGWPLQSRPPNRQTGRRLSNACRPPFFQTVGRVGYPANRLSSRLSNRRKGRAPYIILLIRLVLNSRDNIKNIYHFFTPFFTPFLLFFISLGGYLSLCTDPRLSGRRIRNLKFANCLKSST